MSSRHMAIALLLCFAAHTAFADSDRKLVNADRGPTRASLPFSDGMLVGDTLYIGGHIGLDPKTEQPPADTRLEAKLVMDSIKATVESAGLKMSDVVSIQVYCTDLSLYGMFNEIYRTYFTGGYPPRAFIGAGSLLRGGHFEVLGVAVRRYEKH